MEERLNNYLNSDEFIKVVSIFDFNDKNTFNIIGMLINYTIIYNVIFPDSNNIEKMINDLAQFLYDKSLNINQFISAQVINEYCNTFKIDRNEAEINKIRVFEYVHNKIVTEGYYYHGFNSVFINDIKEKGLTTNTRIWENEDLLKLNNILEKNGIKKGLGFIFHNCQDSIFFSKRPIFTYHYASSSPEWFSIFCGEVGNKTNVDRLAYKKRDYEQAYNNIMKLIESKSFTKEEKKYILLMFKKYWFKFANGEPIVALVKHIFKLGQPMYNNEYDNQSLNIGVSRILHDSQLLDIKYQENIEPDRINYIKLPRYDRIIVRAKELEVKKNSKKIVI